MPPKLTEVEFEVVEPGVAKVRVKGTDGHTYEIRVAQLFSQALQVENMTNPLDGMPMFQFTAQMGFGPVARITARPTLIEKAKD